MRFVKPTTGGQRLAEDSLDLWRSLGYDALGITHRISTRDRFHCLGDLILCELRTHEAKIAAITGGRWLSLER